MASSRFCGPFGIVRNDLQWLAPGFLRPLLSVFPGLVTATERAQAVKKRQRRKRGHAAAASSAVPTTREGFLNEIRRNEKPIPHMYLDSKNYATVGIGILIEKRGVGTITDEALGFDYVVRGTSSRATEEQIRADFAAVKAHAGHNYKAEAFARYTKLELRPAAMEEIFQEKVSGFWQQLHAEYGPEFDSYPMAVQYALLDMIFNMGQGGEKMVDHKLKRTGLHGFVRLRIALQSRDWKAAGDASHRAGQPEARNQMTRNWFYSGESTAAAH